MRGLGRFAILIRASGWTLEPERSRWDSWRAGAWMEEAEERRRREDSLAVCTVLSTIDFDRRYYCIVASQTPDFDYMIPRADLKRVLASVETPAPFERVAKVKGGYEFPVRDGSLEYGFRVLVAEGQFDALLLLRGPRGPVGASFNVAARTIGRRREPPYEYTPPEPRIGYSSVETFETGLRSALALWHEAVAAILVERQRFE